MAKYQIQTVIIHKPVSLEKAKKEAKKIIGKEEYRETENSYRFKNISKKMFDPSTFRTKVINKNISLVVGKCKKEDERSKASIAKSKQSLDEDSKEEKHYSSSEEEEEKEKHYEEEHSLIKKVKKIEKMICHLSKMLKK